MPAHTAQPCPDFLEPRVTLSAPAAGFTPMQLRHAYGFHQAFAEYGPAAKGLGVTIAIVDAYNDPTIQHDLATCSRHFGLPKPDLSVVNLGAAGNTGGVSGWSIEEALDVETIHALLPLAKIVLVEASSPLLQDLAIAEEYAAGIPGVDAVSNSWGAADDPYGGIANAQYDAGFGAGARIVVAAAAGDSSGPIEYPASLPDVVAVGGTVLSHDRHGYHDRQWLDYSAGYADPAKTGPDVRMIGGPPGMVVYGSSGFGKPTWTHAWGTSLSCPAFCSLVGSIDGVRLQRGEAPITTADVLGGDWR
jgi:subtilase family serine protease